jgi:hypothetical protein
MKAQFIAVIVFILLVYGCSRTCSTSSHYEPVKSPVDDMIKEMTDIPSYSIILFDMNTEGSYFKEFYHQYRIIKEIDSGNIQVDTTRWHQVSEDFFVMHMDHMGMEIASKGPDGKVSKTAAPPGYNNYIGNQQYGHWVNRNGTSFWEFYGQYAFMSTMFNMFAYPVRRSYWDDYRGNYYGRRAYYGPSTTTGGRMYGTGSQYNRNTRSGSRWYSNASNSSFKNRVRSSASRSSRSSSRSGSSYRSRGGGFGK